MTAKLIAGITVLLSTFAITESFAQDTGDATTTPPQMQQPKMAIAASSSVQQPNSVVAEFEQDKAGLDAFRDPQKRTLRALREFADPIRQKWAQKDKTLYLRFTLMACQMLTSFDFSSDAGVTAEDLAAKYALEALGEKEVPADMEAGLVSTLLPQEQRALREAPDDAWPQLRNEASRRWLHAWQAVNLEVKQLASDDMSWRLPVPYPKGAGVGILGAGPEAIKDPKLRAEYEAALAQKAARSRAYWNSRWLKGFQSRFSADAERYLIAAYSRSPYDTRELKQLLDTYQVDKDTQQRILTAVAKAVLLTVEGATPDTAAPQDAQK